MYFWEIKIWENDNHCISCTQSQENSEKEWAIDCKNARNLSKDEWEDHKTDKIIITDNQKIEKKSLYHFYEISISIKHFLFQKLDHSWFRNYHTCFQWFLLILKLSESIMWKLSYYQKFRSFNFELQKCNSINYKKNFTTQKCDFLHKFYH